MPDEHKAARNTSLIAAVITAVGVLGAAFISVSKSDQHAAVPAPPSSPNLTAPTAHTVEVQSPPKALLENARSIAVAAKLYASNYDDTLPDLSNPSDTAHLIVPFVKKQTLLEFAADCIWNPALSKVAMASINDLPHTWLLHSNITDTKGEYAVCFADQHCSLLTAKEKDIVTNEH